MQRIWTEYKENMKIIWTEYQENINRIWIEYEYNLNAARIPAGQNWVWWVLGTRDMFRCLLQRRFLTKCFGSVVVWAVARARHEALLRSLGALLTSLGWPLDPGGVLPWRPWGSFGAILEVSESSGVNPVKVELMKSGWYFKCFL